MTWVSLKMISLGSLLIFNQRAASAADSCVPEPTQQLRMLNFMKNYRDQLWFLENLQSSEYKTCDQVVGGSSLRLNERSISPWTYRKNLDVDRIPREIPFAVCLCEGCIIDQQQNFSFNSVTVTANFWVMKRSRSSHNPDKCVLKKEFIKVPVACICVLPKYAKG